VIAGKSFVNEEITTYYVEGGLPRNTSLKIVTIEIDKATQYDTIQEAESIIEAFNKVRTGPVNY